MRVILFLIGGALFAQNNGTVVGSPTFSDAGVFGTAMGNISSGNYITLPSTAVACTSTSCYIEARFKSSITGYQAVIANNTGAATTSTVAMYGSYGSGGLVCIFGNGTVASAGGTTTDGNYHHIACDLNGTTVRAFVDGVLVGTHTTTFVAPSVALRIGTNTSGGDPVTGNVDNLAIWPSSQHTAGFTPPASAYAGSEGMTSLYTLNTNGNDSAGGTPPLVVSGELGLGLRVAKSGGTGPYSVILQYYAGACSSGTFADTGTSIAVNAGTNVMSSSLSGVNCFRGKVTDDVGAIEYTAGFTVPSGGGMRVN